MKKSCVAIHGRTLNWRCRDLTLGLAYKTGALVLIWSPSLKACFFDQVTPSVHLGGPRDLLCPMKGEGHSSATESMLCTQKVPGTPLKTGDMKAS